MAGYIPVTLTWKSKEIKSKSQVGRLIFPLCIIHNVVNNARWLPIHLLISPLICCETWALTMTMNSCYCMNPINAFGPSVCICVWDVNAEIPARGELGFAVDRTSGEVELIIALGSLQGVANTWAVGAGCGRRWLLWLTKVNLAQSKCLIRTGALN